MTAVISRIFTIMLKVSFKRQEHSARNYLTQCIEEEEERETCCSRRTVDRSTCSICVKMTSHDEP